MKKITLLSLIGMILFSEAIFASVTEINTSPGPIFWIKISLNFHRPKYNCLSGFGICLSVSAGVDKMGMPASGSCPGLMAINDQNQLLILVTEENLRNYENGSTLPYFKDKTTITLEDSYTLPPATCKELGANDPVIIRPGRYTVSFANNTYTVTIPL